MIEDGDTGIGDSPFHCGFALESIPIPESATSIGARAFCCSSLTTVVFGGSAPELADSAFLRGTADTFCPEADSPGTEDAMQDCGGRTDLSPRL